MSKKEGKFVGKNFCLRFSALLVSFLATCSAIAVALDSLVKLLPFLAWLVDKRGVDPGFTAIIASLSFNISMLLGIVGILYTYWKYYIGLPMIALCIVGLVIIFLFRWD